MKTLFLLVTTLLLGLAISCSDDDDNTNNGSGAPQTNSVSGEITYNGLYTGQNTTIYIRGYKTNSKAIGTPDYMISISDAGNYSMDLEDYEGDLYLSAFMDVDNSGSSGGLTASETLNDGVYADPGGCYGDYLFNNGGPTKITVDGAVTGINFELQDNGVIKASFSNTGDCTLGVIATNVLSSEFLHHRHCSVESTEDSYLLVVPAKDSWYCKVKFDDLTAAQLYANPVNVTANSIFEVNF